MRYLFFALFLLFSSTFYSQEIDMQSHVDQVTIYHMGARVERISSTPISVGKNDLVFKNVSSKIILNSLKINNKEITILNKRLIKKLTPEEYSQLLDKKQVLENQLSLIEMKFKEQGFISEVEDLEQMNAFYSTKVLEIKKRIRAVDHEIAEAKALEAIELDNEDAGILKLTVSLERALNEPLVMQYVTGGIGWSPAYELTVDDITQSSINMKYMCKLMSQTGEDWENVKVSLSSAYPLESPNDLPQPKKAWVLAERSVRPVDGIENEYGENPMEKSPLAELEGVEYRKINATFFLKTIDLKERFSIKANSTVFTFPIDTYQLPANYYYYGYPSLDPEVYLVAKIGGWDDKGFVDGVANINYNNSDVGRAFMRFSEVKDSLVVAVGKDNRVFMERKEIADQKYFKTTTFGKNKHTTLAYSFEVKNNNDFPIKLKVFDQIPVSQTRSVDVKIQRTDGATIDEEFGEASWDFDLAMGESSEKELIYDIQMDIDYTWVPRQKVSLRSINCPSF